MADTTLIYDQSNNASLISQNYNYWKSYGLNQSPFEDHAPSTMYYPIPHWQTQLQYLQQFHLSSHPILLLRGEFGIGKSMLLSQFITQMNGEIAIYSIKGRNTITATQLVAEIAQGFQLPVILQQPTLSLQIQAELAALQNTQKTSLLIIDDADLLNPEALANVMKFATHQHVNNIYLYIILASELDLQTHLENLSADQGQSIYIPTLHLTSLTIEETKNYLRHRLMKAGLSGKWPFSKDMLQMIYELSAGVPGRINRVAQQLMIDLLKPNEERIPLLREPESFFAQKKAIRISVVAILLIILTAFYIHNFVDTPEKMNTNVIAKPAVVPAKKVANATVAAAPVTAVTPPLRKMESEVIANVPPKVTPVTNTPEAVPVVANSAPQAKVMGHFVQTDDVPLTNLNSVPQENSSIASALSANIADIQEQKDISEQPITPTDETTLTKTSHHKKTITSSAEKSLLQMQGYTLQMLASRNPGDLKHFIANQHLSPKEVKLFNTTLEGKPWHVLIYGNYATPAEAAAALKRLSAKVHAHHPWVRPMSSVHQAILQR